MTGFCGASTRHVYETLISLGYPTVLIAARDSLEQFEAEISQYSPKDTFVFFNCDGFNGATWGSVYIAEILERLGFGHTGAPSHAIALITDKPKTQRYLAEHGVPTPPHEVFAHPPQSTILRFPLIVKPSLEDASLGIHLESVVTNLDQLAQRVKHIVENYRQPALVEEFVPGRELAVAMWGNGVIDVLPLYEQDYSHIPDPLLRLLTYEAKWVHDSPLYDHFAVRCPAELPAEEEQAVREVALRAYRAVGLRDFGRMDIRLRDGTPYVIDVNDLPDLGPASGFHRNIQAAGYTYAQMIDRILTLALKREGWI